MNHSILVLGTLLQICKHSNMSNNLDAPNIKYVKLMKLTLNRINYYYEALYTNLHYSNVYVEQYERHLSNSIDYCKYYQTSMDTLAI